jgi:protein-S-isoprenylcysteine O-methyltransferase Ste14
MLTWLLLLAPAVSASALLLARRDYRKRGKLTSFSLLALCAMLFVPNLMLEYATRYAWPSTPIDYFGAVLSLAGLVICIVGIATFRSLAKVFCLDAGALTLSGIYRSSRNPQYVGTFLFLLGFALTDWSGWCLVAMVLVAVNLHLLVLVEEEHLRRVFGVPYRAYCDTVPRYAGWPRPAVRRIGNQSGAG